MAEDINAMLENLKFSEEKSVQAVGKIMAEEKPNREAMHRVFRTLWFTKEEVNFVALKEDVIIVKFGSMEDKSKILNLSPWLFDNLLICYGKNIDTYEFNLSPFWLRVYNIPLEYMDRQTALDVGNAIGELVAIDWKDRNGGWTEFLRLKIKINISNPMRRVVKLVGRDGIEIICALKYKILPTFCYYYGRIGHTIKKCKSRDRYSSFDVLNLQYGSWLRVNFVALSQERGIGRNGIEIMAKQTLSNEDKEESKTDTREDKKGCEEDSVSNFPLEKRSNKPMYDGLIREPFKDCEEEITGKRFTRQGSGWQTAPPTAMKILCWSCRGIGNLTTIRELRKLFVANDPDIIFICETKTHTNKLASICSKCRMDGCLVVNAICKSGGLAMMWDEGIKVEIKNYSNNHIDSWVQLDNDNSFRFTGFYGNAGPNKRQSSWDMLRKVGDPVREKWIIRGDFNVNNREGDAFVKERLDRFLISSSVYRDQEGRKPRERIKDPRLKFRYDVCWAKDNEAKNIIKNDWQNGAIDIMGKFLKVGHDLRDWQYQKYKRMRKQIGTLQMKINSIIDEQYNMYDGNRLKAMRLKLGKLLDKEEKYWAQRSRINWLKEGDRNTRFFHVRAMNWRKKSIERLKGMQGNWKDTTKDISEAAREYFQNLFESSLHNNEVLNLDYIENCISGETNGRLLKDFTNNEIMEAFNKMDLRKAPRIDSL
ncbi:hypothetical protein CXB51_010593 [Gossypium anomalum]|uniref:DUF4283 domain-containing protein n=1 Tax=Gossypium anomalum TaxID=47600 RepID=A0A8J5ZD95_9ROSI|nr:hypothetical protein CXB51_010593 [Gossypium anomalum]